MATTIYPIAAKIENEAEKTTYDKLLVFLTERLEFKNFLIKKMQSVNETYGDEFEAIVSEKINGKTVLDVINEFENIDKNDAMDKLIYVVSKNIITVEEINKLLSDM